MRVLCVGDLFLSSERIRESIIKGMGRGFGRALVLTEARDIARAERGIRAGGWLQR